MRIGIVTGEYPPMQGGVGAFSHILAAELSRQGHTLFVFASAEARQSDPTITLSSVLRRWDAGSLRAIGTWARSHRLDIVNLQYQTAAYGMSPWIHFLPDTLRRVPLVTTFHDLRFPYLFPKAGPIRDWIVRHLARSSDGVIATNHEDERRLRSLSRAALIPIGSNILKPLPPAFDAAAWREKAGARDADFLLAYFGLVNRSKGIETLLHSLADLRGKGMPVRLVIIGGGAGSSDPTNAAFLTEISALTARLELTSFVYQTGYLSEEAVGAYLAASDAVALPFLDGASYRRGSLMAAIHYGCAIVTTTPQVEIPAFRHDENMLLVPPGDSAALSREITRLHGAPELRDQLRHGAAKLAKAFRWDAIARDSVTFFRQTIEGL